MVYHVVAMCGDVGVVNLDLSLEILGIVMAIGEKRGDIGFSHDEYDTSFYSIDKDLYRCNVTVEYDYIWMFVSGSNASECGHWANVCLSDPDCFKIAAGLICDSIDRQTYVVDSVER